MRSFPPLRLRPSVIVALEVLASEDSTAPEVELRRAVAVIGKHFGDQEVAKLVERRLLITGNRALRVAPVKRGGTILFWELMDLLHLQAELVHNDILLRGAISIGNAAATAGMVVGPGPMETEALRDDVACVPRIIVDPRLLRETEQNPLLRDPDHSVPVELGYIRKLLRTDADGLWFVDYLRAFATEVDEPSQYINLLERHRYLIQRGIELTPKLTSTSRAWIWLWSYHNRVLEEIHARGVIDDEARARLRISAPASLAYVFPPSATIPD